MNEQGCRRLACAVTAGDEASAVLWSARRQGARLWLDQDQVRFDAAKGAITPAELDKLRSVKREIADILRAEALGTRSHPFVVPLTYSQMAHWKQYRLWERPAIRHVAAATRLLGELNIDALCDCLKQVVLRHDALRTRIVVIHGEPFQKVWGDASFDLAIDDLSAMSADLRPAAVLQLIDEHIRQPIQLSDDPLFAARIIKVARDEHVLVVAMEHIISDAVSLAIVTREIFTAYTEAARRNVASLPFNRAQFSDYAVEQCRAEREFVTAKQDYWRDTIAAGTRLKFPPDVGGENCKGRGAGQVPVNISASLRDDLQEWARANRTTVAMAAFTCYAALVLRWCGASEGLFPYVVNGRDNNDFENTVGCFASAIFIKVELHATDTVRDLVAHVVQAYCRAFEYADRAYLEARFSPPPALKNSSFNWIAGEAQTAPHPDNEIARQPVSFENPVMQLIEFDREPSMMLMDTGAQIDGCVVFDHNRLSTRAMVAFADEYIQSLQGLITDADKSVAEVFVKKRQ